MQKTKSLLETTLADELILTAQIFDHHARLESFEIGAQVCKDLIDNHSEAA